MKCFKTIRPSVSDFFEAPFRVRIIGVDHIKLKKEKRDRAQKRTTGMVVEHKGMEYRERLKSFEYTVY